MNISCQGNELQGRLGNMLILQPTQKVMYKFEAISCGVGA